MPDPVWPRSDTTRRGRHLIHREGIVPTPSRHPVDYYYLPGVLVRLDRGYTQK